MKKEGIQTRRRKSKKSKSPKKGSLDEAAAIVAASLGVGSSQQFDEKSKYFFANYFQFFKCFFPILLN